MILITGGAYHGKRNYAKQMYPGIDFVDGISCAEETIFACQGMDHFHSYIENRMHFTENIERRMVGYARRLRQKQKKCTG